MLDDDRQPDIQGLMSCLQWNKPQLSARLNMFTYDAKPLAAHWPHMFNAQALVVGGDGPCGHGLDLWHGLFGMAQQAVQVLHLITLCLCVRLALQNLWPVMHIWWTAALQVVVVVVVQDAHFRSSGAQAGEPELLTARLPPSSGGCFPILHKQEHDPHMREGDELLPESLQVGISNLAG